MDTVSASIRHLGDVSTRLHKPTVTFATAAALPSYARSVNTITASANGAAAAVDGVTPAVGDRLLLKNGAAGADNGIWVYQSIGGASAPFILVRADDFKSSDDIRSGMQVHVRSGNTNQGTWFLSTDDTVAINSTSLTFQRYSVSALAPGLYTLAIAFSDLGSGTASAHALTGFPTNVYVLAADVQIVTAFAGEADLAVTIGDTGDADGKMGSVNLNAVAAGSILGAAGAEQGMLFEADFLTAGADATFSATELDDVTAGELLVRVYYETPTAV